MAGEVRNQNDKLDLFKCAAIYSVVLAHIPLPGQFGRAVCALAKFSVVLFFLVSGYFSWGKDSKKLGRRAAETGRLLLEVSFLLLLFGCVLAVRGGDSAGAYLLSRLNPFFLKEILFYQVLPLPYAWPLWFLASLLIVYILWWGMTRLAEAMGRTLPYGLLAGAGLLLLAVHFSLSEVRALRGLEPLHSMYVRNAWLDALPFFALGAWAGAHQDRLKGRGGQGALWAGFALSALLALAEFRLVGVIDVLAGTTLMALLLLVIAVRSPRVNSPLLRRTACFCGRNLTFYIFAVHVPLFGVMREWREQVPLFDWMLDRLWALPFVVAALSTAIAFCLYQWSARRRAAQTN